MDGSWWGILAKPGSLVKGMAKHFRMKRRKDMTMKDELPTSQVHNILLENSEEITPETRNRARAKAKTAPVVDVTGDGSKV